MALYDRLSGHYNEAKGFVRHALAAATSARPQLMFDGVLLRSAMTEPLLQAVKSAGIRRVPARISYIEVHRGLLMRHRAPPSHPCMRIA